MEIAIQKKTLWAGIAAVTLVAGTAGLLIGRSGGDAAPAPAAEEAGHADEKGGAEAREGFVEMTAERLQASGVLTSTVQPGSISTEIIAQATVAAPPEGQALITARADGAVVRIDRRLGDPVSAGQTIALLESRDAAAFVAQRNAASANAQAARAAAARERRLFNARITARQDLEAAEAARAQAEAELQRTQAAVQTAGVTDNGRYLAVRSPINGRITGVDTQLGAYVTAGTELFNVADPRRIQIDASVPAVDAQRIRPGDSAVIELPNGSTVTATVRSSTPALDPQSRTATVVLQLSGAPGGLTQGQAVRARITPRGSVSEDGFVLPEEAVQQFEGRDVAFVKVASGFQAVPVTVGSRSGGRVQIVEGIKAGQTVVTTGAFILKSQLGASDAGH